ncbi:MAG: zinc ribbon domain-containing protein [Clostridiaceae bacterium]|nr:zinc ribbon domain-containing protein [Clostridiaceae bacterium]
METKKLKSKIAFSFMMFWFLAGGIVLLTLCLNTVISGKEGWIVEGMDSFERSKVISGTAFGGATCLILSLLSAFIMLANRAKLKKLDRLIAAQKTADAALGVIDNPTQTAQNTAFGNSFGYSEEKYTLYCKYCGEVIDSDSVFCKACGRKQN